VFVLKQGSGLDIIMGFADDTDLMKLEGLSFEDLTFSSLEGSTLIKIKGEYSAILHGIDPTLINTQDFMY